MRSFISQTTWLLLAIPLGSWLALMFAFSPELLPAWRIPAAVVTALIVLLSMFRWKRRLLRAPTLMIICLGALVWGRIQPSNDRNWAPEVKNTPWAEVNGDLVTIHNIRNFNYRSESDFDPIYDTRTYNVNELSEVDMLVVYWGSKPIAHLMVSFGFNDRDFLAFSIETRKEVGESYSAINGFFRNYELTYVVADERDVIGVRTNHRNPEEQVYVLRTRMALDNGQKLFLEYVRRINKLHDTPQFYNTLTTNCTTQVLDQVKALGTDAHYDWKILLSGYVPEYLYEADILMPATPLDEIMRRSLVNEKSKKFAGDPNFSLLIRKGVPRPIPRAKPL
jgi:hypothetical protein